MKKMWVVVMSGLGVRAGIASRAYQQKRSAIRHCTRLQRAHAEPPAVYDVDYVLVPQSVMG